MKKIITFATLFILNLIALNAQEVKSTTAKDIIPVVKFSDNINVKFGGWVRAEYYIDSRENVGAVDDLFSFFPENKKVDANGNDMNAVVRQNFSAQASRFNALVSGPDILKAKSSSFFEFDFTGGVGTQTSTGATNPVGFRLRHAYAKLAWNKSELLIGKTWSPLAETTFPSVVGLHTGIPFRPFGRGEQVRFTLKPTKKTSILMAAFYQSEHKSFLYNDASTNTGAGNSNDIRSNPIPDLHLQLLYKTKDIFAGLVSEYKIVRPATQTTGTAGIFNTNETVSSYSLGAFADYKKNLFQAKISGIYAQNLTELFQSGGYAVKSYDAATGARTYTPSNTMSYWANVTYGKTWVAGLFGGYSKNLGFNDNLVTTAGGAATFLGRWQNVDHIYRIAPSLKYNVGNWQFGAELDYNVAAYGTVDNSNKGKVTGAKEISGVRGLLATTFFF